MNSRQLKSALWALSWILWGCDHAAPNSSANLDCGCNVPIAAPNTYVQGTAAELAARANDALSAGDSRRAAQLFSAALTRAKAARTDSLLVDSTLSFSNILIAENRSRDALPFLAAALERPDLTALQRQRLQYTQIDCRIHSGQTTKAQSDLDDATFSEIENGPLLKQMLSARVLLQTQRASSAAALLEQIKLNTNVNSVVASEYQLLLAAAEGEAGDMSAAHNALVPLATQLRSVSQQNLRQLTSAMRLLAELGPLPGSDLPGQFSGLALRQLAASDDPRTASMVYGYIGRLAEVRGELAPALDWTRKALGPASASLDPGLEMLWNWQLARIFQRQGDMSGADLRFRAAAQLADDLESARASTPEIPRFIRHERPQDLLRDAADFLLRNDHSVRAAPEVAWKEAIGIMNSRRELEVQDFLQDQCLAALRQHETPVETAAPRTAILHVLVLSDRTEVILQLHDQIFHHIVPVGETAFNNKVNEFRGAITDHGGPRFQASGTQLYDWLIRPFESHLTQVDTLVLAVSGRLQLIPFAALNDGKQFLIERMAVATTPSLRLLDAHPTSVRGIQVLGAGLSDSFGGFDPLGSAETELGQLENSFHSTTLLNKNFTLESFQSALAAKSYSIVHVVSHAEVGVDPDDFFILTSDRHMKLEDLDQSVRPTLYREQPLDLLVLSACKTATGDDRVALGLAGVALKAGARSTMASLWPVNDDSTSDFMHAFYNNLLSMNAPGKAQSLRAAQLYLLHDSAEIAFRKPYYWAPFILMGNWQ